MSETLTYLLETLAQERLIVLLGGPATGKSYWARRLGLEAAALHNQGRSFDLLSPIEQDFLCDTLQGPVRLCCLYPGFDYSLFVEGYRWEMVQGQATQVLRSGVFKRLCQEARAHPEQRYYLILEDIQALDLRLLFGELWGVLDTQQQAQSLYLALSQERFVFPDNLSIIATACQGVSPWQPEPDLFRRFLILPLSPDYTVLEGQAVAGLKLKDWLWRLNLRLKEQGQAPIGQGYFFEQGQLIQTADAFVSLFWNRLMPLLVNLLTPTQALAVLGEALMQLWNQPRQTTFFKPEPAQLWAALHSHFGDCVGALV
jgi:5-methylcytosine-specific restriction enzyme B